MSDQMDRRREPSPQQNPACEQPETLNLPRNSRKTTRRDLSDRTRDMQDLDQWDEAEKEDASRPNLDAPGG